MQPRSVEPLRSTRMFRKALVRMSADRAPGKAWCRRVSRRHDVLQGWVRDASKGLDSDKLNNLCDDKVNEKSYIRKPGILRWPANGPTTSLTLNKLCYGTVAYLASPSQIGDHGVPQRTHVVFTKEGIRIRNGWHISKHRTVPPMGMHQHVWSRTVDIINFLPCINTVCLTAFWPNSLNSAERESSSGCYKIHDEVNIH